jgi:hypothetical protein
MIAGLMGAEATQFFINREARVEMLSDQGIIANLDWVPLFCGRISEFQPGDGYTYHGEIRDVLSAEMGQFNLDRPVGRVLIGNEHYGCPKDMIGQMYPHVVGEHSDEGTADRDGGDIAQGALPAKFVGYAMLFADGSLAPPGSESMMAFMRPPTGLGATVVGTPGSTRYLYSVSAIVAGYGETARSVSVLVTNGPATLDGTNYIRLTWSDPPEYGQFITSWRVMGRSLTTSRHLKVLSNSPVVHQYEDKGQDSEKLPVAPQVGTAQGQILINGAYASGWGKMLCGLGAIRITGIFGSDLGGSGNDDGESRDTPKRVRIPLNHPDIICPFDENGNKNPAWPFPDTWIELFGGIRATYFGVKGPILQDHLDGKVTMTFNGCGYVASGGEYDQAAIPALTDTFARPNETPMKYPWRDADAFWGVGSGMRIVSQELKPQQPISYGATVYRDQYGPDFQMYFQITGNAMSVAAGNYYGFEVCIQHPGDVAANDCYDLFFNADGSQVYIGRYDAGVSAASYGPFVATGFGVGSWVGFARYGDELVIYHQPPAGGLVEITRVTDNTHLGAYWALLYVGDASNAGGAIDNFGARTVPNASDAVVDSPGQALKMYLNEMILKNKGQGYRAGPFGPLEKFTNGIEVLRTSTFDAFDVLNKTFILGGYKCAWYIDDKNTTLREFITWFNQTFGTYLATVDFGQIALLYPDDSVDPDDGPRMREHIEIQGLDLPRMTIGYRDAINARSYQWHWLPDKQEYRNPIVSIRDDTSLKATKLSPKEASDLGLRCTNHRATADDAQARQLARLKWPPDYQEWTTGMVGNQTIIGSTALVTHNRGGGRGPYNSHPFWIMRREQNLNDKTFKFRGWSRVRQIGLGTPEPGPSDPTTTYAGSYGYDFVASDTFTDSSGEVFQ